MSCCRASRCFRSIPTAKPWSHRRRFSTLPISFLTNTNLQHYVGEQTLSYFTQIFFICWNMFVSASVGVCALAAIIRGLRGDSHMGNFYLDMWRTIVYLFLPASLVMGVLLLADGVPMTLEPAAKVATVEPGSMGKEDNGDAKAQQICRGPVAAIIPIKHLGTNGGGFFFSQLSPSVRKPQRLEQHPLRDEPLPLPFYAGADVRANAQANAACLDDFRSHDVALDRDDCLGDRLGTLQPNPALEARNDLIYPQEFPPKDLTPALKDWAIKHAEVKADADDDAFKSALSRA